MFTSILGHSRQLKSLSADISSGRLSHAYLFVGPEEVGKSTVAKAFMAEQLAGHSFDCKRSECFVCRDIRAGTGNHLISYWDDGESLKVEQMREMIEKLSLHPADGILFCLIENIERLTHGAANAFLKILEEPTENVIFLLLSVHVKRVLPTILSRVRALRFSDVGEPVLKQYLSERDLTLPEVENILKLSGGKVGLAMKLIEHPEFLERSMTLFQRLIFLFEEGDLIDRFAFAEEMTDKDEDKKLLSDVLRFMAIYLREKGVDIHAQELRSLSEAKHLLLSTNVNKRMLLERVFLQME